MVSGPCAPASRLVAKVAIVAFVMRVGVASVPPMAGSLNLSSSARAVLLATPIVCFAVGAHGGAILEARLGSERGILLALVALVAGLGIRAVWLSWALFPGTALAGFSAAWLNALIPGFVRDRFAQRFAEVTGIFSLAITLGIAIAAGVTVPIYRLLHHSAHVALGLWCLPIMLAIVIWMPQVVHRTRRDQATLPVFSRRTSWSRRLRSGHLTVFIACQYMLFYVALSWAAEIYRSRGLSPSYGGVLLTLLNVTALPTTLGVPMMVGRMDNQRLATGAVIGLTAIAFTGIWFAPVSTAIVWVVIFGVAQGAAFGLSLFLIGAHAKDGPGATELSGWVFSVAYLCAGAGTLGFGLLHEVTGAWGASLALMLAVTIVSWHPGMVASRRSLNGRAVPYRCPELGPTDARE